MSAVWEVALRDQAEAHARDLVANGIPAVVVEPPHSTTCVWAERCTEPVHGQLRIHPAAPDDVPLPVCASHYTPALHVLGVLGAHRLAEKTTE